MPAPVPIETAEGVSNLRHPEDGTTTKTTVGATNAVVAELVIGLLLLIPGVYQKLTLSLGATPAVANPITTSEMTIMNPPLAIETVHATGMTTDTTLDAIAEVIGTTMMSAIGTTLVTAVKEETVLRGGREAPGDVVLVEGRGLGTQLRDTCRGQC